MGIEIKNKEGKKIGRITTKAIEAAFALSENQDFRAVTYVTNSESQLQKQLPMFQESASTFRIRG